MKQKYPIIIHDSWCAYCEQFTSYEFIGLQQASKGNYNFIPLYNAACCGSTRSLSQIEGDLEKKIARDLGEEDTDPAIDWFGENEE